MQALPHHYVVTVTTRDNTSVEIQSPGLQSLPSAPPAEFGGPGNLWSPETLTVAAVADCMVMTFRSIAQLSKLPWTSLACDGKGTVDRVDGVTRFSGIHLHARLVVPAGTDIDKARRLLEKAEKACLVSNSLKCDHTLTTDIVGIESPSHE